MKSIPGDTWRKRHDSVKQDIVSKAAHAGVQVDWEVYGVFSDLLPAHIGRATRFVDSGFPTLLILGPTLLILGPPLSILGPFLLILEPILLILVVKMGVAILKKTDTIQTVDSGFE